MESYSFFLLVSLSSAVFSQRQDLSSCGSWSKFNNTASRYGDLQPHIYNQYTCMLTCMGHPLCDSVDYDPRASEGQSNCFLHYTTSPTELYNDPSGATHWKFTRNAPICGVECMYAFAANQNAYNEGGTRLARVGDTWTCRKACIDRPGCVAYDWYESNNRGDQCYLHTTKAEMKQRKNVYHYIFTREKCTCNPIATRQQFNELSLLRQLVELSSTTVELLLLQLLLQLQLLLVLILLVVLLVLLVLLLILLIVLLLRLPTTTATTTTTTTTATINTNTTTTAATITTYTTTSTTTIRTTTATTAAATFITTPTPTTSTTAITTTTTNTTHY